VPVSRLCRQRRGSQRRAWIKASPRQSRTTRMPLVWKPGLRPGSSAGLTVRLQRAARVPRKMPEGRLERTRWGNGRRKAGRFHRLQARDRGRRIVPPRRHCSGQRKHQERRERRTRNTGKTRLCGSLHNWTMAYGPIVLSRRKRRGGRATADQPWNRSSGNPSSRSRRCHPCGKKAHGRAGAFFPIDREPRSRREALLLRSPRLLRRMLPSCRVKRSPCLIQAGARRGQRGWMPRQRQECPNAHSVLQK